MSDEILKEFDIPPSLGNYFEGMADEIIRLRARLAAAERAMEALKLENSIARQHDCDIWRTEGNGCFNCSRILLDYPTTTEGA